MFFSIGNKDIYIRKTNTMGLSFYRDSDSDLEIKIGSYEIMISKQPSGISQTISIGDFNPEDYSYRSR